MAIHKVQDALHKGYFFIGLEGSYSLHYGRTPTTNMWWYPHAEYWMTIVQATKEVQAKLYWSKSTVTVSLSYHESCSLINCTDFKLRFLKCGHSFLDILYFHILANRSVTMQRFCKQPFLGNSSVNTFPQQRINIQQRRYPSILGVSTCSVSRTYKEYNWGDEVGSVQESVKRELRPEAEEWSLLEPLLGNVK